MKKQQKMKKKTVMGALILAGIVGIGTTFAFSQLNQQSINPEWHESFGGGGRIHNIFQTRDENTDFGASGTRNQNIFAENFSDIDLGVRVQLREFLQINGEAVVNAEETARRRALPSTDPEHIAADVNVYMTLNNTNTWALFLADDELDRVGTSAVVENAGVAWTLGQADDTVKIFMPTFNQINRQLDPSELIVSGAGLDSIFNVPGAYRFVDTSGRSIAFGAGDFNIGDDVRDITGVQTGAADHNGLRDFWNLDTNYYHDDFLYTIESGSLVRSAETVRHYAQETLTPVSGGIMSLTTWLGLDETDRGGNFWIFDDITGDGYFYWNGFIPAGEATSLLLDSFSLVGNNDLDYVIHVSGDFFSAVSMPEEMHPELRPAFGMGIEDDENETQNPTEPDSVITIVPDYTDAIENGVVVGESTVILNNITVYQDDVPIENPIFEATIVEQDVAEGTFVTPNLPVALHVDRNETRTYITIRVTETRTGIYTDIRVALNEPETASLPGMIDIVIPATGNRCEQTDVNNPTNIWTDETGFQWCVVAEDGDYFMLVARYTLQMTGVNGVDNNRVNWAPLTNMRTYGAWPTTTEAPLPEFPMNDANLELNTGRGPEGRYRVHTWWNGADISPELRSAAVDATIPANLNANMTEHYFDNNAMLSSPIANSDGHTPVFFLSQPEVYQWMEQRTPASRITNRVTDTFDDSETATSYWLRSMGHNGVSQVGLNGGFIFGNTPMNNATHLAFRPAVWVRR